MLDNTPFAQYSNIIDFIMAVLERSDYVYVPPTGNYRTRLELVTIRSMELIEDIFLGNSEEVLEKYTIKKDNNLIERLEKLKDYIVGRWETFEKTIDRKENPGSFTQKHLMNYDEDLLTELSRFLESVTALVVFFVKQYHQLMILDIDSLPKKRQELLRKIGSLLIDVIVVRLKYNEIEILLLTSNQPSRQITSLPGSGVQLMMMMEIYISYLLFDESLIAVINSNKEYEFILQTRLNLFKDLIQFSSLYYGTKGADILVNIFLDLLEKERADLVEEYIKISIDWFNDQAGGNINPTSFISAILESLIVKAKNMKPPLPSPFLQQCLISLMLVAKFPEASQIKGDEISILEDFEYIIDEMLLTNVERTFMSFSRTADYFVHMFIILSYIYIRNPTEIETKVVKALDLTKEKYVKSEFISAAIDGVKHYLEETKIPEFRQVEENLRKLAAEIKQEK